MKNYVQRMGVSESLTFGFSTFSRPKAYLGRFNRGGAEVAKGTRSRDDEGFGGDYDGRFALAGFRWL
jgi:hypothetical protein